MSSSAIQEEEEVVNHDERCEHLIDGYNSYFESRADVYTTQISIIKSVSLLSAIGSAHIIFRMVVCVKDAAARRKNLDSTFMRLLLGLCVSDCIASIALFFASWYVTFHKAKLQAQFLDGTFQSFSSDCVQRNTEK